MPGLISSLHHSSGALRVHSKGLEVVGKNLANINNREYAKQRIAIGDRGSIETGVAVESLGIEVIQLKQNRDTVLDKTVMRETSAIEKLYAEKNVLEAAQVALGQFLDRTKDSSSINSPSGASGGGLSDFLVDFFNTWESLSAKPLDIGVKEQVVQNSKILAEKFNLTLDRLRQVQQDVRVQVEGEYDSYNRILNEIRDLNKEIAKAEIGRPGAAVDLRDKRQAKISELSKFSDVNFETILNGNGQIEVTAKGTSLDRLTLVSGSQVSSFQTDLEILFPERLKTGLLQSTPPTAITNYSENRSPKFTQNIDASVDRLNKISGNLFTYIESNFDRINFTLNLSKQQIETFLKNELKQNFNNLDPNPTVSISNGIVSVSLNSESIRLPSTVNPSEMHKFDLSYGHTLARKSGNPETIIEAKLDSSYSLFTPDQEIASQAIILKSDFTKQNYPEFFEPNPVIPTPNPYDSSIDPLNPTNVEASKTRLNNLTYDVFTKLSSTSNINKSEFEEFLNQKIGLLFPDSSLNPIVSTDNNGKPVGFEIINGSIERLGQKFQSVDFNYTHASNLQNVKSSFTLFTRPTGLQMDAGIQGKLSAAEEDVHNVIIDVQNIAQQLSRKLKDIYGQDYFLINGLPGSSDFSVSFNNNITAGNLRTAKSGPASSNNLALEIAALANQRFSTSQSALINGTFVESFNGTVTRLGTKLSSINSTIEDRELSLEMAKTARDNFSGVSQDEEITDMMKFQRSFQASARHLNIVDTLLEQVVNRLGVG